MHKYRIPILPSKFSTTAFTLVELIIVIIIVGILAAVGISQYSATVEKSRLAEARVRIGTMRQLAYEYYLNNGTLTGMQYSDVGVDGACHSTDFYSYCGYVLDSNNARLQAYRCASGGKTPNAAFYTFGMNVNLQTGAYNWFCNNSSSACFGYSYW